MGVDIVKKWHAVVESGDPAGLDALLADEAVFHSPVVHTPQRIDDFKVLIRPLKAVNHLHGLMARMLEQFGPKS